MGHVFIAISGGVKRKHAQAHNVIWNMVHGEVPEGMFVDHIDGVPWNNALSNLRLATPSENSMNRRTRSDNLAGIKGVGWHKSSGKYIARIVYGGKRVHLGSFDVKGLAAVAYAKAALRYHGQFARFA